MSEADVQEVQLDVLQDLARKAIKAWDEWRHAQSTSQQMHTSVRLDDALWHLASVVSQFQGGRPL